MARRDQTLYRDTADRKIAGVCSGLGHYFDIDTNLVRVFFVVITLIGGGGILAYALLWFLLDDVPEGYWDSLREGAEPAAGVIDVTEPASMAPPAEEPVAEPAATDEPTTAD